MDLRVTPQVLTNRAISYSRRNYDRLAQYQLQASTGSKLLVPSDGPLEMLNLLNVRSQEQRFDAYLGNVTEARTNLNVGVTALVDAGSVFSQARQIAIEGANASTNPEAYEPLAKQVDALLARLIDLANTQQNGRYLFGGTSSQTSPFVVTNDVQGRPMSVSYRGSPDASEVSISLQQSVFTHANGSQIFQQRQRGTTVFFGTTGAAAGTGTDSATGQGSLLVRHTATTYAGGSGIQAGTSSAASDTILGPAGAHNFQIVDTSGTGASGSISLNGGPPIPFNNTMTDLRVSGPNGEVAFVNTTAITAGFNGNVAITSDGTLSVDGGASSVPINFSGNQVVTNSVTGAVTNVNSTNVRRTGADTLSYTGAYDSFEMLIALRDDLRNTRNLTPAQQQQSIGQRLGELNRVHQSLLGAVGEQSVSLENLDAVESRLRETQLESRVQAGELESVDMGEVVLNLQTQSQLLELSLRTSARILDLSLLDFLR